MPSNLIPTHNACGWTSDILNQVTCELLASLDGLGDPPVILDVGSGLGVATLPLLKAGAKVIANDIDEVHLSLIRAAAAQIDCSGDLQTQLGRFPDQLDFQDLDAVHCSNVLHFLSGDEIVCGARRMYEWLRQGGKVFIQVGTIYAGHIQRLLPIFERRRRDRVKWAGETWEARALVLPEFRDLTPPFMNYLDGPPLVEAFENVGFITERAWYYTRHGLPEVFVNDGREHFGYIGRKGN